MPIHVEVAKIVLRGSLELWGFKQPLQIPCALSRSPIAFGLKAPEGECMGLLGYLV